jgi:hypothetical protein
VSPAALAADPAFFPGVPRACYGALRPEGGPVAVAAVPAAVTVREALEQPARVTSCDGLLFLDPAHFVPGSLGKRQAVWAAMMAGEADAPMVLRWLAEGPSVEDFAVPFRGRFKGVSYDGSDALPPPREFANSPVVYSDQFVGFVRSEIAAGVASGGMRALGRVGEVPPPRVVCPLSVEPRKPRLVCDGRYVNLFQQPPSFALDSVHDVARAATPGALLSVWDHKSGYFHVPLAPATQQFFGFEFEGTYYVYTVLPFDWNVAPLVYQTLSRAVSRQLRRWGGG